MKWGSSQDKIYRPVLFTLHLVPCTLYLVPCTLYLVLYCSPCKNTGDTIYWGLRIFSSIKKYMYIYIFRFFVFLVFRPPLPKKIGGSPLYWVAIKVQWGLVIPKECSQWHKSTRTNADGHCNLSTEKAFTLVSKLHSFYGFVSQWKSSARIWSTRCKGKDRITITLVSAYI